jgi:uncharacterized protein YlxW (UPF0749 family)
MKNLKSQIAMALVCLILGFMLTYQFRLLRAEEKRSLSTNVRGADITAELEQLKKQKGELEKKNSELSDRLKRYEQTATNNDELASEIKNQLDNSRVLLGVTNVEGSGLEIVLEPKDITFTNSFYFLTHEELVYLINELNFAGAEAISINDIRITAQSGIRTSNNGIFINDERISPINTIIIRAIGDKVKLESALSFPGALNYQALSSYYDVKFTKVDNIKMPRYNRTFRSEFLKPVK